MAVQRSRGGQQSSTLPFVLLIVTLGAWCCSFNAHAAVESSQNDGYQQVINVSKGVVFVGQPLVVSFDGDSADVADADGINNNNDDSTSNLSIGGVDLGFGEQSSGSTPLIDNQQTNNNKPCSKRRVSIQFLRDYLKYYGQEWRKRVRRVINADWNRRANLEDKQAAEHQKRASTEFQKWVNSEWRNNITRFDLSVLKKTTGSEVNQLRLFFRGASVIGVNALSPGKFQQWTDNLNNMTAIYGSGAICPFENRNCNKQTDETLKLQPDIEELFRNSTQPEDHDKLVYMWTAWADAVGKPNRQLYLQYVKLLNEGARANGVPGLNNGADLYQRPYATPNFPQVVQNLLDDVKPLYRELHAFFRHRLRLHYGSRRVPARGPIPAHLLGSTTGFSFRNLLPILTAFPDSQLNLTAALRARNFTIQSLFEVPDKFFASMGLPSLAKGAPRFFQLSLLEPPTGGLKRVCHGSAWDFYATDRLPGDFRINTCATVNENSLNLFNHEMGHIQYFMQYVKLNPVFRDSPHPGFHEAVAGFSERSARQPSFLQKIGLIELETNYEEDRPAQLSSLLQVALNHVAALPSSYAIDVWRWAVFNGSIPTSRMNTEYWNLRRRFQGIQPPVRRTEQDFDPATIFHVVFDVDVIRYFLATFLQFQFQQALCEASGQFDPQDPDRLPLHLCNVAGSKLAGLKLKRLMEVGSSQPWQEILFRMTGSREISSGPLLVYFRPLRTYLRSYLAKYRVPVGWDNEISCVTEAGNC